MPGLSVLHNILLNVYKLNTFIPVIIIVTWWKVGKRKALTVHPSLTCSIIAEKIMKWINCLWAIVKINWLINHDFKV